MPRSRRWLLAVAWVVASAVATGRGYAEPQSPTLEGQEQLAAARKLFADALRDEQAGRFEAALEEFRRVRDVRDTAPVEYRIGTCLEGLGHLVEALSAYDAAVRRGEGDASQVDLVAGSRERLEELSKRVAHLELTLSRHAASDAEVRIDGVRRPTGEIALDPGSHRVEATASGAAPFRSDVVVSEGTRVALDIPLDPSDTKSTREPASAVGSGSTSSTALWGWTGIGVGSAFLVGSVATILLRESDIRTANRLCPGGGCVGSVNDDALSATRRARVEGPLGVALGVTGVVVAGLGLYLVLKSRSGAAMLLLEPMTWQAAGLELRGGW